LWRTPNTRDGMQSGYSDMEALKARWANGRQVQLVDQVKMWPTPTQDSATDRTRAYTQGGTPLTVAVKMWRTPNTVDSAGGTRVDPSSGQVQLCHQVGGALNPTWVEWLMGFPLGWTDCGPSETRSSRRSSK